MEKRRSGLLVAILICVMTMLFSGTFEAAGTKRMTVYNKLVRKGNMVCCIVGGRYDKKAAIVAVDIRSGSAKRVAYYPTYDLTGMMIKGSYLYFLIKGQDYSSKSYDLYRVNLSTGKKKYLASEISGYAISGNNIYFRKVLRKNGYPYNIIGYKNMIMKLSGQSKRSSSVKALNKHKNTNAPEYKVLKEEQVGYLRYYLLKPTNEKIYIGQFEDVDYYEDE